MPLSGSFVVFLTAALTLNLTPGPDMLYVLGRSIGQGRSAGVVSAFGIFVGCLFHISAAALGFAALLKRYPLAFNLVRYFGAAYLIYLAVRIALRPLPQSGEPRPRNDD